MKLRVRSCWIALFALLPAASGALPWNKDMVDQPSIKAQEKRVNEPKDAVPTTGGESTPAPQSLADLVMACLAHTPADRPQPGQIVLALEPMIAALPRPVAGRKKLFYV